MKHFAHTVLVLSVFFFSCGQTNVPDQPQGSVKKDPAELSSTIKLVADSEPGQRMIIAATIYLPGGKIPAKDAILSVWQTDAKGFYIAGGGGAGELHPRIHGRIR